MARLNLLNKFLNSGPLLLLYYLSISEIDTNLEKTFDIFTFNNCLIIFSKSNSDPATINI